GAVLKPQGGNCAVLPKEKTLPRRPDIRDQTGMARGRVLFLSGSVIGTASIVPLQTLFTLAA
uniref:hypothetical protein n=1 Tax=Gemmiger qucibialis TaxID=2997294 RepID=UPI00402521BB